MKDLNTKLYNFIDKTWQWSINATGYLLIFTGIVIIGFQIFVFLHDGNWVEYPLSILPRFCPKEFTSFLKFTSWLDHPNSWLGLHKIINGVLEFIPLSLFAIFGGGAMAGYKLK